MVRSRCMPARRTLIGVVVVALGLLLLAGQIDLRGTRAAGTITVTTTNDTHAAAPATSPNDSSGQVSLRSAIEAANAQGGATTINLPSGTYQLTLGEIPVGDSSGDNISIVGQGTPATTTIRQTTPDSRIFFVNLPFVANVTFNLSNVTLTGGVGTTFGGGAILGGGPGNVMTITNVVFDGNTTSGEYSAGAIAVEAGGDLTIVNSTFTNNSAGGDAGAIAFLQGGAAGNLTITNSTFANNHSGTGPTIARGGGAIVLEGTAGNTFSITGSTFVNNSAPAGPGGGAINVQSGTLNLSYSRIVGNTAGGLGTGLWVASGEASVTATDNWWGCNGGPGAPGCDTAVLEGTGTSTLTVAPWLVLSHTASPATIPIGQATTLTAKFVENGTNSSIPAGSETAFRGLPVAFTNATLGTLSAADTETQSDGTATAVFTAGSTDGSGTADAKIDNQTVTANITVIGITLSPATLPDATVGAAYSQTLSAANGSAPYTFAVSSGSLPAGLSLDNDGTLSGTPTAGGSFTFTVTATDSNSTTGSQAYTLAVNAPTITVSPATLPAATVGAGYSQSLSASGGTAPYSFAVTAGSLPAGLSLSSSGTLSGTPTAGGTFSFTVTATDASGGEGPYTGSQAYTLVVDPPTITLSPATLPAGHVGAAYSQSLSASGGTAPYTFALESGALPPGLSLAGDGALSGTPTAGGTFTFTVTATDSSTGTGPYTASQGYSLTVTAVVLSPSSLPTAQVGAAYSQQITASGETPPYTFSVAAGALPPGLSLADDGLLSGTPTAGGTFSFTVTATDASPAPGPYTGSQAYTLVVDPPTITLSPATLPAAQVGLSYSQSITASGGTNPYGFTITSGTLPAGMSLSTTGVLSGTPSSAGTFTFTVTATDSSTGTGPYAGSHSYSLSVSPAATITTPAGTTAQDVATSTTLSAAVTYAGCLPAPAPCPVVDAGTVTFTVTDSHGAQVGDTVSGSVTNGNAGATFNPYGLAPGTYTITAAYHDPAGNFSDSTGTSTLTIVPGPPANLTLAPRNTTATVGMTVTETATVTDALGYPVADGTVVNFTVSGISQITRGGNTTSGQVRFTYGANVSGTDTLTATAVGGTGPSATAQITWKLPSSTPNSSVVVGNPRNPTLTLQAQTGRLGGTPSGYLTYQDSKISLSQAKLTGLVVSGTQVTIYGTAKVSGGSVVSWRLDVTAFGGRGVARLRLSNGYDTGNFAVQLVTINGRW